MNTDELAAFISARLDETEARERRMLEMLAKAAPDACIAVCFDDGTSSNAVDWNPWDVVADYDPARALREVAAKRAIVAMYQHEQVAPLHKPEPEVQDLIEQRVDVLEDVLIQLAAAWADHPDYQTAWAL